MAIQDRRGDGATEDGFRESPLDDTNPQDYDEYFQYPIKWATCGRDNIVRRFPCRKENYNIKPQEQR